MTFIHNRVHKSKIYKSILKLLALSSILLTGSATAAASLQSSLKQPTKTTNIEHRFQYEFATQNPIAQLSDDDSIFPDTELPTPIPDESNPVDTEDVEPLPSSPSTEEPGDVTFSVNRIEVIGNMALSPAAIAQITQPLEGTDVTVAQLLEVADQITALYISSGYITTQAVLVEQEIVDGVVQIQIEEGSLDDIQVEGLSRLRSGYVTSRIERGVSSPLNVNEIEEQLRLLSTNSLLEDIRGRLEAGDRSGTSVLRVDATEVDPWDFGVSIDNFSPPSVGSERLGALVAHNNLSGWGDRLAVRYYRTTTGGSTNWDFSYQVPVNAMEGSLFLQAAFDDFEVTQGDTPADIEGSTERYAISFRQPLIISLQEEFALSAGFAYRDGQTFLGNVPFGFGAGPDPATGISRTSVFQFGQDYTRRDTKGAWALRSQFNLGTGLFDATDNDNGDPDGQFFSWLGQVQRVQQLTPDNLLIIQADLQLAADSLLASEQFVIGGGQSLRGYRQNARSGDNGFRLSIEDRIALSRHPESRNPTFQLAPFIDVGSVWNNDDNPNILDGETFLVGSGLGILAEPIEGLNLRVDYALPLVSFSGEGDNIQDNGLYFSVNYLY